MERRTGASGALRRAAAHDADPDEIDEPDDVETVTSVVPRPPTVSEDGTEDTELDLPLPDAERLVAEAVEVAGEDLDSARLVRRYWRFAADEELVGLTPEELLGYARAHRELAEQRLPGELKLRLGDTED